MIPWEFLGEAEVPGGGTLRLTRRQDEFSIRTDGYELMNSRAHGSEEVLAEEAIKRLGSCDGCRILVGGLGMGYTLRAALDHAGDGAAVTVAELVPEVVAWNRDHYGHLAGHPLSDPRTTVFVGDVGDAIKEEGPWDAILLDVDNGPDGLTRSGNDSLYSKAGILSAKKHLVPGGVLGVWSAHADPVFTKRLAGCGLAVEEVHVKARLKRGGKHTLWFAKKTKERGI
ncbi:spermidine synthase [Desulfoluna spongiiphila]|uniref:Spermidine synthase n=1 Tax=Desulfoluna spongiiphila TaxID=419481 RepID=A0A1G5H1M6_9BACT|nr:hypothetical protein [Desulfoluna spongiiphila]SCY57561.1 hypothetical protein SAMN05216233_11253 [Desulfoluna spongiiphila]VVS94718.1 s-adenosyl-l-methionine-dependent methyltransferase [Desulfoluna spongiiphila]